MPARTCSNWSRVLRTPRRFLPAGTQVLPTQRFRVVADCKHRVTNEASSLGLGVNAQQWPRRRDTRFKVAYETVNCPNLDVAGGFARTVHQNGAYRRSVGI